MIVTIAGTYRDGKVELVGTPAGVKGARVLVGIPASWRIDHQATAGAIRRLAVIPEMHEPDCGGHGSGAQMPLPYS